MMQRHSFKLQVVPSSEVRTFYLTGEKKNLFTIKREELLDYVVQTLQGVTRAGVDQLEGGLRYCVKVFKDGEYQPYISGRLIELLHPSHLIDEIDVVYASLDNTKVVVMASPSDVASLYYDVPEMTRDYEIVIFDNARDEDLKKITAYTTLLKNKNKMLKEALFLPYPVEPRRFKETETVAFIAKRGDDIIGYCLCTLMPYLGDLFEPIAEELDALLYGGEYGDDVLGRYFTGVTPRNLFEIEGLSADPDEKGKSIGLLLLYHALRFMRHTTTNDFFSVTHIASQAASYITKLFLVDVFKFGYHGGNFFLNQHFIETLKDESREEFLGAILQQISYYKELLYESPPKMLEWLQKGVKPESEEVLKTVSNVIRLYQIYYLLLTTSRSFDCRRQETLAKFLPVFKSLRMSLPERSNYATLRDYLDSNIASITDNTDISVSVYSDKLSPTYKGFGFLKVKPGKAGTPKEVIREGYDLIYNTLPNMIALSTYLKKSMSSDAGYVLNCINALVSIDLELPSNYEIPAQQLVAIRGAIKEAWSGLDYYKKVRDALIVSIEEKEALMKKNTDFIALFTIDLYKPPKEIDGSSTTSGFDTYILLKTLSDQWTEIEEVFRRRARPVLLDAVEDMEGIDVFNCGAYSTPPPLQLKIPRDIDTLIAERDMLFDILVDLPLNTTTYFFKDYEYSAFELKDYLNAVVEEVHSFRKKVFEVESDDEKEEKMIIEEKGGEPYRIEDFIDDDLLADVEYSILGDTELF